MSTQKGTINVQTENIFPIIKKYLYSDHEIFLRELVANAVDATQKLKTLASRGDVKEEIGDTHIEIKLDKEAGTLTISDRGIGMSAEEVEKYITQIAFSGAQEFIEKYKDAETIIGHFGLGFYSAFMVADKVEVHTKTFKENNPVKWSCDGSTEYTMEEIESKERGTDIVLFINEESKEFLEEIRIKTLLDKYCKFLPIEIQFNGETINNPAPLWKKQPNELTDEDYIAFYKELYPYSDDPLFWIHLNVDHPFNLTGVLYFPKIKQLDVGKNKIQLYCNQVFVTDNVEEIVPEFMRLMHGVIDSPDIPLNVSRSYLQSDANVKKINSYISRKVADKLNTMFKNEREKFEEKWEDTSVFIKYGMLSDEKFNDKAMKFALLEDTEKNYCTVEEYREKIKETQTDKNEDAIVLYANNLAAQDSFIQAAQDKSYNVLKMDSVIDTHFIGHLEQKLEKMKFKRVDADTVDQLIEKDEQLESVLSEEQIETVKGIFTEQVNNKTANVELKALSPNDPPVTITKPEVMRRFQEMQAYNNMNKQDLPEFYNVVVNSNHAVVGKLLDENVDAEALTKQLYDLALLSQNMLTGADLTNFIKRSVNMMD